MTRQRPTSTELVRALQALVSAVNGRTGSVEDAMRKAEAVLQWWRTGERVDTDYDPSRDM